jgi:hypothetical protein
MAAIDRTAYPRLSRQLSIDELNAQYEPTSEETTLTRKEAIGDRPRLTFLVMLKTPHLKQQRSKPLPTDLKAFKEAVHARMPEQHLLDILKHVHHWVPYPRHFGPPSGSNPKLSDAIRRYLFTVFGFGCNLGATQTARHAPESINRQSLQRINAQHVDAGKLEAAVADIVNQYTRFELPQFWGAANVAIADGTQMELRENNLLGERHIRYGGYGGIAYHHISATYVALFSKFIACGV